MSGEDGEGMADLLGDGETRVYWLPELPDPTAPTREDLEAAIELTGIVSDSGLVVADDPLAEWSTERYLVGGQKTITLTINVDQRVARQMYRRFLRYARDVERASRNPARRAMHAAYARRRKARGRR